MSEFVEAPASATVKVIDSEGFEWLLTVRDTTPMGLLSKCKELRDAVVKAGAHPSGNGYHAAASGNGNGNGNGHTPPPAAPTGPMCPIHNTPMKRNKLGWYCPTKLLDDGGNGKPVYCQHKIRD